MIKAVIFDFFGVIYYGTINQELLDYVAELKKGYKTAILSNVLHLSRYLDPKLSRQYFDVVAASDEIGYAKPDPEAFWHVLKELGVKPGETVMVDDSPTHIGTAMELGMHGILYQNLASLKLELEKLTNAGAA